MNAPDLVLFVGEALVGNEAIDQLVKFNAALADHSASDNPHTIDGIVLTKFDTIDDKVGSAISMTYISGQPIVFVGTGQTYTDLKSINSKVNRRQNITVLIHHFSGRGSCAHEMIVYIRLVPVLGTSVSTCSCI